MAQLNPHITGDVIEANEFPELSQRFGVMGVPKDGDQWRPGTGWRAT